MSQLHTRTGGPELAAPLAEGSGFLSSSAGPDVSADTGRERQVEPSASDPRTPHGRVAAPEAGTGEIQTIAKATREEVPSTASSGAGQAAAIAPEVPAAHARAAAKVKDRPDAGQPETSVAGTEPERPIPTFSPEQVPPSSDAPPAEAGPRDPAPTPQSQAAPASTAGGPPEPGPAVASGIGFAIARQAPLRALDTGIAAGAQDTADAPAPSAAARSAVPSGATAPWQENLPRSGGLQTAGPVEPRRALAPGEGADGDDRGRLERSAAPDDLLGSQVRGTDPSARQQPSGDIQPGRLPQISGLQGNAVAGPHPGAGVSGEVAQVIARAPDGATSVEPGRHPATRQVALQITRALDQDRTEIRIRLDPPELGEVDIQLEFRDLRLTAAVSAERSDTLELLQRDSRALTRALREAGLELADSDLSFAHSGRNDRPDAGAHTQRAIHLPHPLAAAAPLQDRSPAVAGADGFVSLGDGRLDLRV